MENCVDGFSSTGSILKVSLLTHAVGFIWGICVATHLLFDSHVLQCILTWNKHHRNTCLNSMFLLVPHTPLCDRDSFLLEG